VLKSYKIPPPESGLTNESPRSRAARYQNQKAVNLSFRLVRNLSEEGLPTSGNDNNKQQCVLTPMQSIEEFF